MPGTHQRYPDVVTPADVDEMIRNQRRIEANRLRAAPEMTPYAIRCLRHGRVVLNWEQALVAMQGQSKAKCPHCRQECKLDQFWYEHTKERLIDF